LHVRTKIKLLATNIGLIALDWLHTRLSEVRALIASVQALRLKA
jgi:hypothetical protein